MRRIVVTGLGAVTPLAAGVTPSWSRLLAGRSGLRRLPDEIVGDLPAKVGGVVPSLVEDPEAGFDPDAVLAPKDQRKVDRFIILALAAADEALAQASWRPGSDPEQRRTATIIASGIGGFLAITEAVRTVDTRGVRRLSPWRDLPEVFGDWNSVFRRFSRWSHKRVWWRIFAAMSDDPDFEYLIVDSTIIRAHQHASGAKKGGLKIRPLAAPAAA